MSRALLLNVREPEECRAALVEDGRLSLLWVEREDAHTLVGNVYLGRVTHLENSIGAAFVDIGAERPAFLHADDVRRPGEPAPSPHRRAPSQSEDAHLGADADLDNDANTDADADTDAARPESAVASPADAGAEGPAPEGADPDAADAADSAEPEAPETPAAPVRIDALLEKGQAVVVQVVRDPIATKGASLTMELSLPGRTLVLMPSGERVGVSRRIEEPEAREALRALVEALDIPPGMGVVARTAAADATREELAAELGSLVAQWHSLDAAAGIAAPVRLLHEQAGFVLRAVRELAGRNPAGATGTLEIICDTTAAAESVHAELALAATDSRVTLHDSDTPLFHAHEVEHEARSLRNKRVGLPGGAYLVIERTEALWSIDVNSGRLRVGSSLEETALETDLLAARECARQIRLRDLSGLIVIDFIDCRDADNRRRVEETFREELARDPGRLRCSALSEFMLIQVTRRRLRAGAQLSGTEPCGTCHGAGRVVSPAAVAISAVRDVRAALADRGKQRGGGRGTKLTVRCSPDVSAALSGRQERLSSVSKRHGVKVRVVADPSLGVADVVLDT